MSVDPMPKPAEQLGLITETSSDPANGVAGAHLSEDGLYRYELWREFDLYPDKQGTVLWVMLNPSTADAMRDDPTIRKCMGFTRRWGYGRLEVVNLYAYRATKPKVLWEAERQGVNIMGSLNERAIECAMNGAALIVAAWGAHAKIDARVDKLIGCLSEVGAVCLGRTRAGAPRHPLMLSYDTKMAPL